MTVLLAVMAVLVSGCSFGGRFNGAVSVESIEYAERIEWAVRTEYAEYVEETEFGPASSVDVEFRLVEPELVETTIGSDADESWLMEWNGELHEFAEVSGVKVSRTEKTVMVVVVNFEPDEYLSDPSVCDTINAGIRVMPNYSSILSDFPYEIEVEDDRGVTVRCSVPPGTEKFSISVSYRLADMLVSDFPMGSVPERKITEDKRLYEIAELLDTLDDIVVWMYENLTYIEGLSDPRSDIEVLVDGGGDCDELAIFLISLASKMQVPIEGRLLEGYDEWQIREVDGRIEDIPFGHAVAQLKLDDKWVAVDATVVVSSGFAASASFVPCCLLESWIEWWGGPEETQIFGIGEYYRPGYARAIFCMGVMVGLFLVGFLE